MAPLSFSISRCPCGTALTENLGELRYVYCVQPWVICRSRKGAGPAGRSGTMNMRASPVVSLIVPFFNEGDAVDVFYERIGRVLAGLPKFTFEIICIDDGSRDDTLVKLVAIAGNDSRYRIIELSRNFGKEAALTAGIDDARGEAVILLDADLQDPPELIPVLISHWQQGADVVLA